MASVKPLHVRITATCEMTPLPPVERDGHVYAAWAPGRRRAHLVVRVRMPVCAARWLYLRRR